MLSLQTGKLRECSTTLLQAPLAANQATLSKLYVQVCDELLQRQIDQLVALQNSLQRHIKNAAIYLQDTAQIYERLEQALTQDAKAITTHQSVNALSDYEDKLFKKSTLTFHKRFHTSFSKDKSILSYLKNGACVGLFGSFEALSYSFRKNMKYLQADATFSLGKATVSGDAKLTLFENKKFQPALHLEAEGKASLAEGKAGLSIGNAYIHADGEASVGLGVVTGSAKAIINKHEVTLKADVGAAAVRGEVKGSFTLFGLKISATGSAEAGAVGAGVEYSSKKANYIKFKCFL